MCIRDSVTSVTGLEKLNRKHLQPLMQKLQDPKFLEKMMKIIQKEEPNVDFENITEDEMIQLMEKISDNPKMVKAFERLFKPYFKKFNAEYDLDKYTILLMGDKKAEFIDENFFWDPGSRIDVEWKRFREVQKYWKWTIY